MAIPSDSNLALLSNIKDTDRGIDASMSSLNATMLLLLACVVCVQSWNPE